MHRQQTQTVRSVSQDRPLVAVEAPATNRGLLASQAYWCHAFCTDISSDCAMPCSLTTITSHGIYSGGQRSRLKPSCAGGTQLQVLLMEGLSTCKMFWRYCSDFWPAWFVPAADTMHVCLALIRTGRTGMIPLACSLHEGGLCTALQASSKARERFELLRVVLIP